MDPIKVTLVGTILAYPITFLSVRGDIDFCMDWLV